MEYRMCSLMLKGRAGKKINLEDLYQKLGDKYLVDYDPEMSNRLVVRLDDASVLFFTSGTVQVFLRKLEKKEETSDEVDRILALLDYSATPT